MSKRRWVGVAILTLVALVIGYAILTTSALNIALRQVPGLQPATGLSGRAIGPIGAEQLVYSQDGLTVTIDGLALDHTPLSLFGGRVNVTGIQISKLQLILPPAPEDAPSPSAEPFTLDLPVVELPFDIRGADVLIEQILVYDDQGGTLLDARLAVESLSVEDALVSVAGLRVEAVDRGKLNLDLSLDSRREWVGQIHAATELLAPLNSQIELHTEGDLNALQLRLSSSGDISATIAAQLQALRSNPTWSAELTLALAETAALRDSLPPGPLRAQLSGRGDAQGGELSGDLDAAGFSVALRPLAARLIEGSLHLDGSAIEVGGRMAAQLTASGHWPLAESAASGQLELAWSDLEYAEVEPAIQSADGSVKLSGNPQQFGFELDAGLARAELNGRLNASGSGTPERLSEVQLVLDSNAGQAELLGEYQFSPMLAAFQTTLTELKPELAAPDWPGLVSLQAQLRVTEAEAIRIRADIASLSGQLRGAELSGQGEVVWVADSWPSGRLDLGWGGNQVEFARDAGEFGRLRVDARNLKLGAPQLDGRLELNLQVPPLLADWAELTGSADARDLKLPGLQVAQLRARRSGGSTTPIEIEISDLRAEGRRVDQLNMVLVPEPEQSWRIDLNAQGPRLSAALAARLAPTEQGWQGQVSKLELEQQPWPAVSLSDTANWTLIDGALALQRSCLAVEQGQLCLAAESGAAPEGQNPPLRLNLDLQQLSLAPIAQLAPDLNVGVSGELDGALEIQIAAEGGIAASGELSVPVLRLSVPAMDGERVERQLSLRINAAPLEDGQQQISLGLDSELGGDLQLAAQGDLQAATPDWLLRLDANALNLALIDGFSPELVNPQGALSGNLQARWYDGQLAPEGELKLTDVGAELPSAGTRLSAVQLTLGATADGRINVEGDGKLGEGDFQLSGSLPLDPEADANLVLKGSEILVADLPIVRMTASPDLRIDRSKGRVTAKGSVTIPSALIDLARFEPTVKASSDVVVLDDPAQDRGPPVALYADITVVVGDRVRLKGFGLDGRLSGQLSLRERPGKLATARGELDVTGNYRAYGQDLDIQRGKLLFAGGPVANPGLDLLALRDLDRVKAGVRVRGAADNPVLTLYSDPPMDQAEALSYLVLGRPLNSASGEEGQQLGAAAAALGSVGGSLLASKLGSGTGLEVGVESSADLGGAALTVGRFLTPKLYFGVGQSLFESISVAILRYRLSSSWELEGISGREFKAGVNYRMER